MDQIKTGRFLAALRRQAGLTQEALGEKLGVTNKTVSRWENGNYMPDIDTLQLLSQIFQVSLNELLAGERLTEEAFRQKADENLLAVAKESAFSRKEKEAYYIRKWRREHLPLLAALALILLAAAAVPLLVGRPWLAGAAPVIGLVEYAWQNNKMMAYVEERLYG